MPEPPKRAFRFLFLIFRPRLAGKGLHSVFNIREKANFKTIDN